MSRKPIFITETMNKEILESILTKAVEQLNRNKRLQAGKFDFTVNYAYTEPDPEDKVYVTMTSEVYTKMRMLVDSSSDEIGWHGTVVKDGNKFLITDILIYPQVVTGATVTPDQKEFEEWKDSLSDEQFNTLDFHGHSHVNMGVSPSGVDDKFQDDIMSQAGEDTTKIFMITNKKGDLFVRVYDVPSNTVYEEKFDCYNPKSIMDTSKKDIVFDVVGYDGKSLFEFYKNGYDKFVKKTTYGANRYQSSGNVTPLYSSSKSNKASTTVETKSNSGTTNKKDSGSRSNYNGYKGKSVDKNWYGNDYCDDYYGYYDNYYDEWYDDESDTGALYDPIITSQQQADDDKENKEIPFVIPVGTLSYEIGCSYSDARKIINALEEMYEVGKLKDVSEKNLVDQATLLYEDLLEGGII